MYESRRRSLIIDNRVYRLVCKALGTCLTAEVTDICRGAGVADLQVSSSIVNCVLRFRLLSQI